ncbi:hypothetical protein [Trinickia mobilis]|uniref:hypothetical protein n=1 Tax=Trinickia mobilis TaxID=2816356 RepID=UPI001A8E64DF|nr:hypothetical protein [Trinickia mobilis]
MSTVTVEDLVKQASDHKLPYQQMHLAQKALDSRARRAAKKLGFIAHKSRSGIDGLNNHGGFTVLDGLTGFPVYGYYYELDAQDVIEWCNEDEDDAA